MRIERLFVLVLMIVTVRMMPAIAALYHVVSDWLRGEVWFQTYRIPKLSAVPIRRFSDLCI